MKNETIREKKVKLLDKKICESIYEEIPHTILLDFLKIYSESVRDSAKEFPDNEDIQKTADIVEGHINHVIDKWQKLLKRNIRRQVQEQTKPTKEYITWLDKA